MRIVVVSVGRLKEPAYAALVGDYLGRLGRYLTVDSVEIDPLPVQKLVSRIEKAVEGTELVVLDVGGRALSSEAFAERLEGLFRRNKGVVSFVIGGADGVPQAIVDRATERWSLSALTFPHRLARLVLIEQIYRALTILRGEPYAH